MNKDTPRRRGWDSKNDRIRQAYWNGWQDRDDQETRAHEAATARTRRLAAQLPADELAERRGDPEKAQRIREFWQTTGLRIPPNFTGDPAAQAELVARCRASWDLDPERRTPA